MTARMKESVGFDKGLSQCNQGLYENMATHQVARSLPEIQFIQHLCRGLSATFIFRAFRLIQSSPSGQIVRMGRLWFWLFKLQPDSAWAIAKWLSRWARLWNILDRSIQPNHPTRWSTLNNVQDLPKLSPRQSFVLVLASSSFFISESLLNERRLGNLCKITTRRRKGLVRHKRLSTI